MSSTVVTAAEVLFRPFDYHGLLLKNRIVMAPMTRAKSAGGVPGEEVAAYYRRRAEGGVGLIVTEGTYIPHAAAGRPRSIQRGALDELQPFHRDVLQRLV